MKWEYIFWLFTHTSQQLWCEKSRERLSIIANQYILICYGRELYHHLFYKRLITSPPQISYFPLAHRDTFTSLKWRNNTFYQAEWAKNIYKILGSYEKMKKTQTTNFGNSSATRNFTKTNLHCYNTLHSLPLLIPYSSEMFFSALFPSPPHIMVTNWHHVPSAEYEP